MKSYLKKALIAGAVLSSTILAQAQQTSPAPMYAKVESFDERSLTIYGLVCSDAAPFAGITVMAFNKRDKVSEITVRQNRGCERTKSFSLNLPKVAFDLMQESEIRIFAIDPSNGQRVELQGSGFRGRYGVVQTLGKGLFRVRRDIYESDGRRSYCKLADDSQVVVRLGYNGNPRDILTVPDAPIKMKDAGDCAVLKIPAGAFWLDKKTGFYSNGVDAFCAFSSPDHYTLTMGKNPKPLYFTGSLGSAGAAMRNDNICGLEKLPAGFFQIIGEGTIFYVNGVDAYCGIPSYEQYQRMNPRKLPVWQLTMKPSKMADHGVCAPQ